MDDSCLVGASDGSICAELALLAPWSVTGSSVTSDLPETVSPAACSIDVAAPGAVLLSSAVVLLAAATVVPSQMATNAMALAPVLVCSASRLICRQISSTDGVGEADNDDDCRLKPDPDPGGEIAVIVAPPFSTEDGGAKCGPLPSDGGGGSSARHFSVCCLLIGPGTSFRVAGTAVCVASPAPEANDLTACASPIF